jgi:hypothetical protein
MSVTPFQAIIRGIRENPAITEVNVRLAPTASQQLLFKCAVGMSNLTVLDVQPDEKAVQLAGRVYQWLKLNFPNGQTGWVRDDLLDVVGDGTRFGYGIVAQPTPAGLLNRSMNVGVIQPGQEVFQSPFTTFPPPAMPTVPSAPTPAAPTPPVSPVTVLPPAPVAPAAPAPTPGIVTGDLNRVRRAAFNMTSAWEGGGYATYQTYDAGIISYGRFQFTLAAGSFITVLTRYLERAAANPTVDGLQAYMPRITAKDQSLRQDASLKMLCQQAAQDPIMQAVQDEVATEGYWQTVIDLSITPRNIQSPMGYALLFDMSIQHGRFNHIIPGAETALNLPPKSRLGENGTSEQTFIRKVAELRLENLNALAKKLNLPGMARRGEFWVNLVALGDWNLQGDANGTLNVNGKTVQVRNP